MDDLLLYKPEAHRHNIYFYDEEMVRQLTLKARQRGISFTALVTHYCAEGLWRDSRREVLPPREDPRQGTGTPSERESPAGEGAKKKQRVRRG